MKKRPVECRGTSIKLQRISCGVTFKALAILQTYSIETVEEPFSIRFTPLHPSFVLAIVLTEINLRICNIFTNIKYRDTMEMKHLMEYKK